RQDGLQYGLCDQNTAMTGDLNGFLTSVRFWVVEKCNQHFINYSSVGINNRSVMDSMALLPGQIFARKGLVYSLDGLPPGNPNNGNTAVSHRCGDGGNRLPFNDVMLICRSGSDIDCIIFHDSQI